MHILFAISLVVQIALAAHAYQHGRTSPWVWIILFFPLAGSLLYVALFLRPRLVGPATAGAGVPFDGEQVLRPVPRGPFAPAGDRPDAPIPVASVAETESHAGREECPACDHPLRVEQHRADTIAGRSLRVVILECGHCGALPVRYFELHGTERDAPLH